MKAFVRWVGKIVGSAITILLVIVLCPYVSHLASKLLPDISGSAIKTSAVLASRLENSARLETIRVQEEGVLNYDVKALFLDSVANINVKYDYEASFGIDLNKVKIQVSGNHIVFSIPQPVLIQDSLTPTESVREDVWDLISDNDYQKLLNDERTTRRNAYLNGENSQLLWDSSISVFEHTIASWIKDIKGSVTFEFIQSSTIQ